MATSESTARLARKVKKNEEDIRVHGDEIDKVLRILKGHTGDLSRIDVKVTDVDVKVTDVDVKVTDVDVKVTDVDAKVAGVDATLALIDSRVDKIEGGQTMLRLNVDNLRSDVKTVDGRLVRVERSLSRHGELLEEVLRLLEPRGD